MIIFEGRIAAPGPGKRHWQARIPQLRVFTQGRSEKDAHAMVEDALQTLVGRRTFRVQVLPVGTGRFLVQANDSRPLIARWLHRLRVNHGLSLREAAARLGAESTEAWARYESGRASPTVENLEALLHAIDPDACVEKGRLSEIAVPMTAGTTQLMAREWGEVARSSERGTGRRWRPGHLPAGRRQALRSSKRPCIHPRPAYGRNESACR